MSYEPDADSDLVAIDASHLFEASVTKVGIRKGTFMRSYMYRFIEKFAPHLNRELVEHAMAHHSRNDLEDLFSDVALPTY